MRGGIVRMLAAAALAALLVLGLAACGGDDETTTPSRGSTATSPEGQGTTAGKDDSRQPGDGGKHEPAGNGDGSPGAGEGAEGGAEVDPAPLQVSGGGSDQFRVKGGDNSIQGWGEESDESELEAAAGAVHDFYVARANEEWATACTYLGEPLLQQLEQFAQKGQGKPPECAALLKMLTRHPLPASVRRESTIVDAGSLRIGEDNSFLIYRGVDGTVFAMPLVEEDDAWKVTLLSPTTLG